MSPEQSLQFTIWRSKQAGPFVLLNIILNAHFKTILHITTKRDLAEPTESSCRSQTFPVKVLTSSSRTDICSCSCQKRVMSFFSQQQQRHRPELVLFVWPLESIVRLFRYLFEGGANHGAFLKTHESPFLLRSAQVARRRKRKRLSMKCEHSIQQH